MEGENEMITDGQARRIASEWHDGQVSGLYSLASTGRVDSEIRDAVQRVISQNARNRELMALRVYVFGTPNRSSVPGWHAEWSEAVPTIADCVRPDISERIFGLCWFGASFSMPDLDGWEMFTDEREAREWFGEATDRTYLVYPDTVADGGPSMRLYGERPDMAHDPYPFAEISFRKNGRIKVETIY